MESNGLSGLRRLRRLSFEDFPIVMFFKLLGRPDPIAERVLGASRWAQMKEKWEESENSLESDRLLEDQKRAALPLMKAQKATMALRWATMTPQDIKPVMEELNLPWDDDPAEFVKLLQNYAERQFSQYQNNLIQLEATQEQQKQEDRTSNFTIKDGIATLNLAGFTIMDPDRLTIGEYQAMNRAIERNNG